MVEFCEKCGAMLVPHKEINITVLKCNICGKEKSINDEIKEEYYVRRNIEHQKDLEIINLEEMEYWKKNDKK